MLGAQSDERLVKLARAGQERAFAVIVERYRPELSAFARRLSPDGRAEDIVQQAFLSAFAALRSGADVKHLRGWLYRIVRNAAARSQAPLCMPLDGSTASGESVEDVVQQRVIAMDALAELGRLPTRQRQAMVGTALDGRGRAEVATSMGVSEGAVRQLVHRARARIRTAVTALVPWPLVKWLPAARPGSGGSVNVAAGVGAASSGGLALKLGIVLASGAVGAVAVDIDGGGQRPDRAGSRAAARIVHPQAVRDDQVLTVAVVARAPVRVDRSQRSRTAGQLAVVAPSLRGRRGGDDAAAHPAHRQDGGAGSGLWGSDYGNGRGSSWGGGRGSGSRGGAGSSWGAGAGSSWGSGAGSRYGDGGRGVAGPSFSGPQAVIASDGGSTRVGDWSGRPASTASDSGFGSGSGAAYRSGSGPGFGAGSVPAPAPGSGPAPVPGSGAGPAPGSGPAPASGSGAGYRSADVGSVPGNPGSSPAGGGLSR
jgi:RNA polymerase sigma factor (sigma-70 family)